MKDDATFWFWCFFGMTLLCVVVCVYWSQSEDQLKAAKQDILVAQEVAKDLVLKIKTLHDENVQLTKELQNSQTPDFDLSSAKQVVLLDTSGVNRKNLGIIQQIIKGLSEVGGVVYLAYEKPE